MRPSRALPIRHVVAALVVAVAAFAGATPAAHATVTVGACFLSDESRIDSWTPSASTGQPVQLHEHCGDTNDYFVGSLATTGTFGFTSTTPAPDPAIPAQPGRVIGYTVTAPAGTSIQSIKLMYTFSVADADWEIRVKAGSTVLATCAGPTASTLCGDGVTESLGNAFAVPPGTQTFDVGAYCVAPTSCDYVAGGEPTFSGMFVGAEVVLDDTTPPTAAPPEAAGHVSGKLTSSGMITIEGSDSLGLRRLELLENGVVIDGVDGTCVDWSLRVCADASAGASTTDSEAFPVGALGLSAGTHTLTTRAIDAAGLVTISAPTTVTVDETVLAATKLSGGGRSGATQRILDWEVPVGMIAAAAKVELCPAATPTKCKSFDAEIDGPFTFYSDAYPDVLARVQLFGPGGAFAFSEPLGFQWDTAAPKQPKVTLLKESGDDRLVEFTVDPGDTDVARYKVNLCTLPANKCTELTGGELASGAGPTSLVVKIASQGLYRVDVFLTDAAGNTGLPGQLSLHYTAPPISVVGKDQPLALVPKLPAKLPKSSIVVRGAVPAGSAAKITVTISGRNTKRKAVRVAKVAKVGSTGAFAVRIKLPKRLNRKQGLLVTFTAKPSKGYLPVTVRRRVRG